MDTMNFVGYDIQIEVACMTALTDIILRLGWKPETTFQDVTRIWNPEENEVWQEFIESVLRK